MKWAATEAEYDMTILNCTLKLATRIPFPIAYEDSAATNTLGPWSGNTFHLGRIPFIILTNERTLLSVVISLKDVHTFWMRFLASLETVLHQLQIPTVTVKEELQSMREVTFMRATNRRTLGSMNDLVHMVRAIVAQEPNTTLEAVNLELSGVVSLALQGLYPKDAVHQAFNTLPPQRK